LRHLRDEERRTFEGLSVGQVTFACLVDGFLDHLDARCKTWGVQTPDLDRELVAGALAGMLNDGLITGHRILYEVHTELRPDTGTTEAGGRPKDAA
jgi:hypothetical protein